VDQRKSGGKHREGQQDQDGIGAQQRPAHRSSAPLPLLHLPLLPFRIPDIV
jgi:hypothetical protein